jgi:hypothetical protein
MNDTIKNDLMLFKNAHKNIVNIIIHIICGCIYVALLSACLKNYEYFAIVMYSIFVYCLTNNITLTFVIFGLLYCIVHELLKHNINMLTMLSLAFLFYLLPEIGHMISNEQPVLSDTVDIQKITMNMLVLLPYSFLSI